MHEDQDVSLGNKYAFKPFSINTRQSVTTSSWPKPRSGHRIVCNDGFLYSFGGYNPMFEPGDPEMDGDAVWFENCPLFKELWCYTFASNSWNRILVGGNIPKELASNAVVLNGELLMVFGGTSVPFGDTCSNKLYVFNTTHGTRMRAIKMKGKHPPKQYGQALVLHDKYLYTVGGTTGFDYSSDIHRLNLQTKVWEEVYIGQSFSEPPGRYRHEVAFDGKRIYLFGGGSSSAVYGFDNISAFNLDTRKWEVLVTRGDPSMTPPGIPHARLCHGCVQFEKSVFICGGYDGQEIYSDVWKFDLISMQWTCLRHCCLPRSVYFHSAAISPAGQMFTFGGIVDLGTDIERTAEMFSVWVCIPKLSEICWECITCSYPSICTVPPDRLFALGVPKKFIDRLKQISH